MENKKSQFAIGQKLTEKCGCTWEILEVGKYYYTVRHNNKNEFDIDIAHLEKQIASGEINATTCDGHY